jgi:hypothetical protein
MVSSKNGLIVPGRAKSCMSTSRSPGRNGSEGIISGLIAGQTPVAAWVEVHEMGTRNCGGLHVYGRQARVAGVYNPVLSLEDRKHT